ncbi:MAG: BACON domain-containing protein [Bacteroidales bacterium]|jgi:hypothetical protein|nr:BACON domain-containing protein [Bacteroidales bacterium]
MIVAVIFWGTSCDAEDKPESRIATDVTSLTFEQEGGSLQLAVRSNTDWTIDKSGCAWVTVNTLAGSGNQTITVTAPKNTETYRTGQIVLRAGDKSKEVNIAQYSDEQPSSDRLSDVSGKQIDILGWWGIRAGSAAAIHQDMADAGFTVNMAVDLVGELASVFADGTERFFSLMDATAAVNMKTMVSDFVFDYLSGTDIDRLKSHPALFGYFIHDEPRQSDFPEMTARVNKVQALDSAHPCYINLAPCLYCADATPDSWMPELSCGPAFPEPSPCVRFVQKFIRDVPVPILSFDMYPIWQNTVTRKRELQVRWYYTLEVMSSEARKAGKPLWAFALSTAHKNFEFPYPLPTLNDIRLQVYSDLAYGAQCIQYFTYAHVANDGWQAPTGPNGEKQETWYIIKEVNEEIKALSPVFLNATVEWIAHTGEIPAGCTALDVSKLPSVFHSLNIDGGKGALVSLMKKGNDHFLVIVNHDINEVITVQASGTPDLRRVKKDGSVVIADNRIHTVMPGDVLIYFWKQDGSL